MLLAPGKKLEELVVETLAAKPHLTADEILHFAAEKSRAFTIQAVYQELRKLERSGVVVRKGGRYNLRLLWLVEMSEFIGTAYNNFLRSGALSDELPAPGKKKRWVFTNLRQLLDLWTELTFIIVEELPRNDRVLYEYVEHVWFHTANPVNEDHFDRAMKRENVSYVLVCRGKTHLDQSYREILRKLKAKYSFGGTSFPAKEGGYLSLIGPHVIDVKLSPKLASAIEEFYSGVQQASDLRPQALLQFAALKGRCSLELSLNEERALRERKKFEHYFGRS